MKSVPRHLLLAAVVLTLCCAQRQAASATVDLGKMAAEVAGERLDQSRSVQQQLRQRRQRHRHIRPAAVVWRDQARAAFVLRILPATAPQSLIVHAVYPPSRFRLPPPAILA